MQYDSFNNSVDYECKVFWNFVQENYVFVCVCVNFEDNVDLVSFIINMEYVFYEAYRYGV